jgi:hypothetical protein
MRTTMGCLVLAAVCAAAAPADDKKPLNAKGVILQFNGKKVQGTESSTKVKGFKGVFEKELAKLAKDVKGKPELKITHWYTVINGCAVSWGKADDATARAVIAKLKKLPYVKTVELDEVIGIKPPGR